MSNCVVCDEVSGTVSVPGGGLRLGDRSLVFHAPPLNTIDVFLGHLLVVPRRHVADFADLENAEAADVGVALHAAARALKNAGATRVYVMTIGHAVEHLHVHVIPRWPETPADVVWHSVDEWSGARRGTFDDAAVFARQLEFEEV